MIDFEELGDKDLLLRDSEDDDDLGPVLVPKLPREPLHKVPAAPVRPVPRRREPINRRMQVLVLHGRQSNENLVGFQIAPIKSLLAKDADFHILEAERVWVYDPGHDNHDADTMSRTLSKGKDFKTWFRLQTDDTRGRVDLFSQQDPAITVTYDEPEQAVDQLLQRVEQGPVDVVLTIFEGSIVVHMAVARLLAAGRPVPWRLSVFFGSQPIRDDRCAAAFAEAKAHHPTVHVFGRMDESYYYTRTGAGRKPPEDYYHRPVVLEHGEGHRLPTIQPAAAELFGRVVSEMRYQCGLVKAPPKKVPLPPKPLSLPLLDLSTMLPRRLRVLALCGGHSCAEVLRIQTLQLKAALGGDAVTEWVYLEGTKNWTWYEGEPVISEMEEKLAKGRQLKNWYMDSCEQAEGKPKDIPNRDKQFDPTTRVVYEDIPEVVAHLRDYVMSEGPFDVLVAFSQGAIMTHLLVGHLRNEAPGGSERWHQLRHSAEQMPWRLSVFFSGMHIRDKEYFHLFDRKSPHPTVHVFGKQDEFYDYARDGFGNRPQEQYYEEPVVLTHDQGHQFPTELPRAREVYERVAQEVWRHCGGRPPTILS